MNLLTLVFMSESRQFHCEYLTPLTSTSWTFHAPTLSIPQLCSLSPNHWLHHFLSPWPTCSGTSSSASQRSFASAVASLPCAPHLCSGKTFGSPCWVLLRTLSCQKDHIKNALSSGFKVSQKRIRKTTSDCLRRMESHP